MVQKRHFFDIYRRHWSKIRNYNEEMMTVQSKAIKVVDCN